MKKETIICDECKKQVCKKDKKCHICKKDLCEECACYLKVGITGSAYITIKRRPAKDGVYSSKKVPLFCWDCVEKMLNWRNEEKLDKAEVAKVVTEAIMKNILVEKLEKSK